MLGFLFRTLTAEPSRGTALFAAATAEARKRHWYVEGAVPDTIDGRFAALATATALIIVRLEQLGEQGDAVSVALTERFIEVMESEHRQLGLGDPKLGRTVRKLVGSLARRTELWRLTTTGQENWANAANRSLYHGDAPAAALDHSSRALRNWWDTLEQTDFGTLIEGKLR